MSQRRYINFGADANASKAKAMNAALAAPQVLRAPEPFLLAVAPDQLLVQPHAVIFEGGLILEETEQTAFTVPTGFSSADYTLVYEHVDEDIIGGTAAILELRGGLFQSLPNSVILGWVRYPGGAVPLEASMVFADRIGQLRSTNLTRETFGPIEADVIAVGPNVTTTSSPNVLTAQTVPTSSPYQLAIGSVHVSRLLSYADQAVRIYDHTAGQQMERIASGTPAANQFLLDSSTQTITFSSADVSHVVDISDVTYGAGLKLAANSGGAASIVDTLYSFAVGEEPLQALTAEFLPLTTGYTVSVVEVFDIDNTTIATDSDVTAPTTADGTAGRLVCRLLDGTRTGTTGQFITVRLRQTVPASGSGLLLRVRATNYNLPF